MTTNIFSHICTWNCQLDNMLSKTLWKCHILVLTNPEVRKILREMVRISFIHSISLYCYTWNKFRSLGVSGYLSKTHCKPKGNKWRRKKCLPPELLCPYDQDPFYVVHKSEHGATVCSWKLPGHRKRRNNLISDLI